MSYCEQKSRDLDLLNQLSNVKGIQEKNIKGNQDENYQDRILLVSAKQDHHQKLLNIKQQTFKTYSIRFKNYVKGSLKNIFELLLVFVKTIISVHKGKIIIAKNGSDQNDEVEMMFQVSAHQKVYQTYEEQPQLRKYLILSQLKDSSITINLKQITIESLKFQLWKYIDKAQSLSNNQLRTQNLLQEVFIKLKNSDIFLFKSIFGTQIKDSIFELLRNIELYGDDTIQLLINIKNIIQCKMFTNSKLYESIFHDLGSIIIEINRKLNLESLNTKFSNVIQNANIVQNQDNFAQYFVEKYKLLNKVQFKEDKHSNEFLIIAYFNFVVANPQLIGKQNLIIKTRNENFRLGEQISKKNQFQNGRSTYLDAIDQIQHFARYSSSPVPRIQPKNSQKITQSSQFLANIQHQHIPDASCLGCTRFFYQEQNIFDDSVSTTPVYSFPSIQNIGNLQQNELLSLVCAFMNFGGGVILFGIKKIFKKMKVQGKYLNEHNRIAFKQQVKRMISERIHPSIDRQTSIRMDFVPIVEASTAIQSNRHGKPEIMVQREQQHLQLRHCEDLYVPRIRVCPYDSSVTYFVKENQILKSYGIQNGKTTQLTNLQINKTMKNKIKLYLGKAQVQRKYGVVVRIPHNFFQHECRQLSSFSSNPIHNLNSKEQQFLEMCLIVVKQKHLPAIKRKIVDKGYNCSIQLKFLEHRFKSAKHTALLYINLVFEEIVKNISLSEQFRINNKALLALRIQYRLKLQKRNQQLSYSRQEFNVVTEWLLKEFPQQSLCLYEYTYNSQKEYYYETETKTACLFLYYLLNNFSEKCTFKEPKGLQLLSTQQRNQNWKLLYRKNFND